MIRTENDYGVNEAVRAFNGACHKHRLSDADVLTAVGVICLIVSQATGACISALIKRMETMGERHPPTQGGEA